MKILIFFTTITLTLSFYNGQPIHKTEWYEKLLHKLDEKIKTDDDGLWKEIKNTTKDVIMKDGNVEENLIKIKQNFTETIKNMINKLNIKVEAIKDYSIAFKNMSINYTQIFNYITVQIDSIEPKSFYEDVNEYIKKNKNTLRETIKLYIIDIKQWVHNMTTYDIKLNKTENDLHTYSDGQWENKMIHYFNLIIDDIKRINEDLQSSINALMDRVEKKLEENEAIDSIKAYFKEEFQKCYSIIGHYIEETVNDIQIMSKEYSFIISQIDNNLELMKMLINWNTQHFNKIYTYYVQIINYLIKSTQTWIKLRAEKVTEEGNVLVNANEYLPVFKIPEGETLVPHPIVFENTIVETVKEIEDGVIQKRIILVISITNTTERIFETVLINSDIKSEEKYIYHFDKE